MTTSVSQDTSEDIAQLQRRLAALRKRHQALDDELLSLRNQPSASDFEIGLLKRKKLALKDQIAPLEQKIYRISPPRRIFGRRFNRRLAELLIGGQRFATILPA